MSSDLQNVVSEIQKELEGFISKSQNVVAHDNIELIPTGIDYFDLVLGGGIGVGTFTVAVGYSGSFKSTLAVEIAKAFRRKYPESPIVYVDTESSMTKMRMESLGLHGVTPLTGFTVEKVFTTVDAIAAWKEEKIKEDTKWKDIPVLIIWDSIANTPSEAETKSKDVNQTIGLKARVISGLLPTAISTMAKYKISMYAINQFRDKVQIGPFASPSELKHMQHDKTMPGGNAIMFNASQLLEFRALEHKTAEESKYGFRHAKIEVKTVKNKFFPDGYKAQLVIDVANGVDNLFTNFELLVKYKKMVSGAWNYLKDYPEKKFRTKDLRQVYESDPKFKEIFDKSVNELIAELRAQMSNFKEVESDDNQDPTQELQEVSPEDIQLLEQ